MTNCLKVNFVVLVAISFIYFIKINALDIRSVKQGHSPRILTEDEILSIASVYNETYFKDALSHILVPRVVGTLSHDSVRDYISKQLKDLDWSVEIDSFQHKVPHLGKLNFHNVIAMLNPLAQRYLVLACHYDSKYFPNGDEFLGATDSAVPCTMMLEIAKTLNNNLEKYKNTNLSLLLLFFDGEEAFHQWSNTDSIYGAKNLAAKWHRSNSRTTFGSNMLDSIDILVLLDLLGAPNPTFYSYFRDTQKYHSLLSSIEKKLRYARQIPSREPIHFLQKSTFSFVEDDHIPFLQRGVPILHIIPSSFPNVWHTMADNYSALDFRTISSLTKILHVFTISYLEGAEVLKVKDS